MTASVVSECPHDRLKPDIDPDYAYCLQCHHTVFIGRVPAGLALLYTKEAEKPSYLCVDCGGPVSSRDTKRCRACLGKHLSQEYTGDKRFKPKSSNRAFGEAPVGRARHDYIMNKDGSGL